MLLTQQCINKGQIIVDIDSDPKQMFILKEGKLKVQKSIIIHYNNLWPSKNNDHYY